MEKVRIYQCFHDDGSFPEAKYISEIRPALLCGSSATHRNTDHITGCLRDDVGENISAENPQYSELTGYYWIWKNVVPEYYANIGEKYIGIEHYRRHFLSPRIDHIDEFVKTSDLLGRGDIYSILSGNACYDIILPIHESLANTSVYDLYCICFTKEQTDDMVKCMNRYWAEKIELGNLIAEPLLNETYKYLADHTLVRGNMMIASYLLFSAYCKCLFPMIDYLKEHMTTVKPESRVWGYVSEIFPMIFTNAFRLKPKFVHVAIDDFNLDTQTAYVHTTFNNHEEEFDKDPNEQIEYFKSL